MLLAQPVSAIPAYPYPITVKQPDGTTLRVQQFGDENYSYMTTTDGYVVVQGSDKYYYYGAVGRLGTPIASKVIARNAMQRTSADRAYLGQTAMQTKNSVLTQQFMARQERANRNIGTASTRMVEKAASGEPTIVEGKIKTLVLLVEYQDLAFTTPNPQQAFTELLNQPGYSQNGAIGSAWDYYNENSNERFDPTFDVVGPFKLANEKEYYGAPANGASDIRPEKMAEEAVQMAANAGVDLSQYAVGTEGRDLFIFFAGKGQAESGDKDDIWPHRYYITTDGYYITTVNGINFRGYACAAEFSKKSDQKGDWGFASIGTFCHEYGHVLGWPDFYDTNYETDGQGKNMATLSLMATGAYNKHGRVPAGLTSMERWMVGWLTPEEIAEDGEYILEPVDKDKAYMIKTPTEGDYFLLENRNPNTSRWDAGLGGSGMLVYHVDRSNRYVGGKRAIDRWEDNSINHIANHQCMTYLQASDTPSVSTWFFPGSTNVTSLNQFSREGLMSWQDEAAFAVLTSITTDGENIKLKAKSIKLDYDGPYASSFKAEPSQYEATISWKANNHHGSWIVKYKKPTDISYQDVTTETSSIHLTSLTAGVKYEMSVTALLENGEESTNVVTYYFTTEAKTGIYGSISGVKSNYSVGDKLGLSVIDLSNGVGSLTWKVDGNEISMATYTLTAGEHIVEAVVVDNYGQEERFIKYITVK